MTRNYQQEYAQGRVYRQTPNGRANKLLHNAKSRAKRKNIEFSISEEFVRDKIAIGKCELTGLSFDLTISKTTKDNPFAPSLDRIDPNKGYTEENTRLILWAANRAIGQEGLKILQPIFKILAEL
jgi:hypothetical protein